MDERKPEYLDNNTQDKDKVVRKKVRKRVEDAGTPRRSVPAGDGTRSSVNGKPVRKKRPASSAQGQRTVMTEEGEKVRRTRNVSSADGENPSVPVKKKKKRSVQGQETKPVRSRERRIEPEYEEEFSFPDEPRNTSKQKAKKRKKKRNPMLLVALIMLLILIAVGAIAGTILWKKYGPSDVKQDLNLYFGIENEQQVGLTINNDVLDAQAKMVDGHLYLSYEVVRDYLSDRFYWDSNENCLLYTLPQEMVRANAGEKAYTVSGETKTEDYEIVNGTGADAYICIDFIKQYMDLDYELFDNPARAAIVSDFGEHEVCDVKKKADVRLRGGVKSPILTQLAKGDQVTFIEAEGDWKKVRTKDGFVGYVYASALADPVKQTEDRAFAAPEYTSISSDKTINMAWHQVTNQTSNSTISEMIAEAKGLTTISPTWFAVVDNQGNMTSIGSNDYVNYAHQFGVDVWALVDNFSTSIDQMELLSHTSARENLENQLITEALRLGIDGINVDFEKIPEEAGEHYIQFIRELSVKCRVNALVLSVDNYVPMGYNEHYHRKEQGVMADYVIIMGYDEHYSGSYEAGSVASYNYVKDGIEQTLKDVPAEKVINAVPFYTRLWKETEKTAEQIEKEKNTPAADYVMDVTSEAMGMRRAEATVEEAGVTPEWDDTVKQNYAQWTDTSGATYKIWLEDKESIDAKLQLMRDYNLAGTSAWKLGFETSDIWDVILQYVN